LRHSDSLYKQLTQDISLYYQNSARDDRVPSLKIYSYKTKQEHSLFSLAARVNLPYETLATLNRYEYGDSISPGSVLLFCNTPGLFVPESPENGLEYLMRSHDRRNRDIMKRIVVRKRDRPVIFRFYPGERFEKTELAYFLRIFFRSPVRMGQLSSLFGSRRNPFSGHISFHTGIDIAADKGSEVLAARQGKVSSIGFDPVLGLFVVLSHEGNYETVYAHLEKSFVELNQYVNSGIIIGTVGNSGLSTGPHLHFEIRWNGRPLDPIPLLPKGFR
jgi:murein DD-endopeptidase MepM/ murein hydrolase activator NlpD